MRELPKILLPVDFSGRCFGAAHFARNLAHHLQSELTLLHVLAPAYHPIPLEMAAYFTPRPAEARKTLDAFLTAELDEIALRRVVLEGDPAGTIVDFAHSEKMNLIVMPTRGYGPFRRFLLGSVTAKVLHDSDCPVATGVHLEDAPPVESLLNRSVVAAIDLGPHSEKVLEWAAGMARAFEARLTAVHAIPSLEAHAGDYFDPNWRTILATQARQRLERLQQSMGLETEILIESGDAPAVVRCAALRNSASLLVIGRGSAGGVFGRLRTNAYAIIREAPCPVVSV